MSKVRVLVGTRKGAFVLTSDGKRESLGRQRAPFRRLGDLPPEGLPCRPEPDLYASQSSSWFGQVIQRSNDGGQDLGAGRQQVRIRRQSRHPPLVRRHAAPVGVHARLASRALADRSRHGLRRRRGRRAVPLDRRRPDLAGAVRAARPSPRRLLAAGRGRACACTPSSSIRATRSGSSSPSRRPGAFRSDDAGQDVAADQPRAQVRADPRPHGRGGPLRAPHRHAPVAARRALHAEALGRHAQRRRRRVVARGQRQPADRLRLSHRRARPRAGDDLRRARSRATPSTIRPTASCACTGAAPAATSGRRSRTVCRSATATSTCCATPCPSTRSIRAACTSAPPADRSTSPANAGDSWSPIVRDLPSVVSVEVQTLA